MKNIKPRREEMFSFYNSFERPTLNICEKIRTVNFLPALKAKNIPVFHYMLYCLCQAIQENENFKLRFNGKHIYSVGRIIPSYTVTDKDDILNFATLEYRENMEEFISDSIQKKKAAEVMNELNLDDPSHLDYIFVTCLPWMDFTSIEHPIKKFSNNTIPSFAIGKINDHGRELDFSFSVQAHHGLVDGIHVSHLIKRLTKHLQHVLVVS